MKETLNRIEDYVNHYDYLDYVNMSDLKWLIEQTKKAERYEEALDIVRSIASNNEEYSLIVDTQETIVEIIDKAFNA